MRENNWHCRQMNGPGVELWPGIDERRHSSSSQRISGGLIRASRSPAAFGRVNDRRSGIASKRGPPPTSSAPTAPSAFYISVPFEAPGRESQPFLTRIHDPWAQFFVVSTSWLLSVERNGLAGSITPRDALVRRPGIHMNTILLTPADRGASPAS